MNFNFNSGFRPMGFPGMPQMHFPTGSNMTPPTPQMPQAPAPVPQTNPGAPAQPAFGSFRDAMHDWRTNHPQFGAPNPNGLSSGNGGGGYADWMQQRPQRSDYPQQQHFGGLGQMFTNAHQQFPFLQQGLLPNFGG